MAMAAQSDSRAVHPLHDRLIKDFLHDPPTAADLFAACLPRAEISPTWAELRQEPCEFVDPWLGQKSADLLFSVPFGDRRLNLGLIFEHLSHSERIIPLRLLQYQGAVWGHQLKTGQSPGPIICVVLYHGRERWTGARNMLEWLKLSEAEVRWAGEFVPAFDYVLLDLSTLDIGKLELRAYTRLVLSLLKSMIEGTEMEWLRGNAAFLDELLNQPDKQARVGTLIRYCLQASPKLNYRAFQTALQEIEYQKVKNTAMSIADMIKEEGLQQGLERGLQQGLERGLQEGFSRGELMGRISTIERALKLAPTERSELQRLSIGELQERVDKLEREFFH
jgi:predicted transposase/invertase (TIGR01784 family)